MSAEVIRMSGTKPKTEEKVYGPHKGQDRIRVSYDPTTNDEGERYKWEVRYTQVILYRGASWNAKEAWRDAEQILEQFQEGE